MPCHHIYICVCVYILFIYFLLVFVFLRIVESWITFLSQHVVTTLHATKEFIFIFILFFDFVNKCFLTPFKHDVHACVFTTMYMFLNCICTRYIKTCIHQHSRLHGITLRS
jgi:hypothetical protein